jgi:hypothetical protein
MEGAEGAQPSKRETENVDKPFKLDTKTNPANGREVTTQMRKDGSVDVLMPGITAFYSREELGLIGDGSSLEGLIRARDFSLNDPNPLSVRPFDDEIREHRKNDDVQLPEIPEVEDEQVVLDVSPLPDRDGLITTIINTADMSAYMNDSSTGGSGYFKESTFVDNGEGSYLDGIKYARDHDL